MPRSTPLSRFIARLVPGTRVLFRCDYWCPDWTERHVVQVRSRDVSFTHPTRDAESWIAFPRADEVTEPSPGYFIILDRDLNTEANPDRFALHYKFEDPS